MNEELRLRGEPVEFRGETDQCERPLRELTEVTKVESCESKEQKEQQKRIEILKNWEITIRALDRGCIVKVGCKTIAFTSLEVGYKEIGRYIENPQLVATQHGFEKHI